MSYDYIELGPSPIDEECVQVSGDVDYGPAMDVECRRFKVMLEAKFPIPDNVNAYFKVRTFQHDFGSYKEVCLYYSEDDTSTAFAYWVDDNIPVTWDDTDIEDFENGTDQG